MYYLAPTSKTSHHKNKLGTRAMLYLVLECVYAATHMNKENSQWWYAKILKST